MSSNIREVDASTKLCPYTMSNKNGTSYCKGKRCMAWQYSLVRPENASDLSTRIRSNTIGYCAMIPKGE